MGRHHAADEYEDDPNEPEEFDADSDDGDEYAETIECPHCGHDVYEHAEQCPKCGRYLSREDSPGTSRPKWVIVTTLIVVASLLYLAIRWGM